MHYHVKMHYHYHVHYHVKMHYHVNHCSGYWQFLWFLSLFSYMYMHFWFVKLWEDHLFVSSP